MVGRVVWNATLYALLPFFAGILGACVAAFRPPGATVRSYIQHFAAGVVFSVVAVELLPDIVKRHLPWEVAIGFGAGVVLMLALRSLTAQIGKSKGDSLAGLLAGVGIDLFIDGLLIGIGFAAGQKEGVLLTVALAIELLSLGLAVTSSLRKSGKPPMTAIRTVIMLSGIMLIGVVFGATLLQSFSNEATETVLSLGLAALLFLVTEELLVEAHEEPETPTSSAMFFAGFLLFLIIGMVS